jgi:thymidylate synthase (FAD)
MKFTKPRAILLADTAVDHDGMSDFLLSVGAHVVDEDADSVDLWETDAPTDGEEVTEVAGRMCYRSFRPALNPNLSKVREGNAPYLKNILDSGHGSVLEHASVTFAFMGVSRVFTHELVRHRAGTAFSQESLRFVRLEELCAWFPDDFGVPVMEELYDALVKAGHMPNRDEQRRAWAMQRSRWLREVFKDTFAHLEGVQQRIGNELMLNELDGGFHVKKRITSAMRRMAPIGLGTAIICTANHRAWRHMVNMRTNPGAESEIRLVFASVARQLRDRFPNMYQDMSLYENVHGTEPDQATFKNEKV